MMKPSAGFERGEVDVGESARLAEDDIGLAGIVAAADVAARARRADEEVVEAVAVDIAGRGDAAARMVVVDIALDDEAVGRIEGSEVDVAEARRLAENDIGRAVA